MIGLYFVLALVLVLVGHAFRLLRWEQFIRIYERPLRGQMLRGMAGGYALNFVLPFHLGDVFRAVFPGRRMKSGVGFALATVIMDRFLDVWFVALGFIAFSLLGQGGAAVRGAARYYLVFSLVLAAALVLGLYPLMRRAQEKPRYMGYVLAAMLVVSGAFVVFVEAYGFSADTDAENLASGIGNAWKMLGAVAGMTLAWLLDRRYIHFETQAVWWVQVIKVAVGMALLLAIKSGLKAPLLALLGHEGLAGGVRYFLLVLVAGAVWPLVFRPMSKWGKGKK